MTAHAPAPEMIGPYRVTGVLGQGAMGIVYKGVHVQTGVETAIKTVNEKEVSRLRQIRREVRALARLDHPGVVHILDHGVADGLPWYAMERLDGTTLRDVFEQYWTGATGRDGLGSDGLAGPREPDHIKDGSDVTQVSATNQDCDADRTQNTETVVPDSGPNAAISADHEADHEAVRGQGGRRVGPRARAVAAGGRLSDGLSLLQRVCETLSFLHGQGVVHRDLKPGNIFVRESGEPILVDFGLAEETSGATGREQIGEAQKASGSPAYMSPEQVRGEGLDARSDLYALGCILYQLITGTPPFAGSQTQVIRGHLERPAIEPSMLVEGVPPALEHLVIALLVKDATDRLGFAETVAWALADLGTAPPAWSVTPPAAKPYLYRPSFVGRRDILTVVEKHLVQAKAGVGTLLLVAGESGAGKTRAGLEVGILARRLRLDVASGDCPVAIDNDAVTNYGHGAPLALFRPLVEAIADRCIAGGATEQARLFGGSLAVLADYFPMLRTLPGAADLPPPPPLPSAAARERLFRALAACLTAHVEDRALLMVLDDLQWADELSMGFIGHLFEEVLSSLPVLLLGAFRAEERTPALDALLRDPGVDTLTLHRLTPDEVGDMACGMLAMRTPPDGFVEFLADRSNGNPFFIAEYLRTAVSERVLVRDRTGRWTLPVGNADDAAGYESLPLPGSLRQLIDLRLGKLTADERRLVNLAALMGRQLDTHVLARAEGVSVQAMLEMIDELTSRQIIEPADWDIYRFVHDKIREIADADIPDGERCAMHRRLAEAFEAVHQDGEARESHRADMGRHWALAGEPALAVPHLKAAAERAQRFHSVTDAIRLYEVALAAVAKLRAGDAAASDPWRDEAVILNEAHGDALALQNFHAEARAAFDRAAADAADAADAAVTLARLHRKAGKTHEIEHDHDAALSAYHAAETALGDRDALGTAAIHEWIQIVLNRVWVYYWLDHPEKITSELEMVRPTIETAGLPTHRYHYFMALMNRNNRRYRYRVPTETLRFARSVLEAALESGAAAEVAFAHFILGFALLAGGELEEAEAELFEASQGCQRIGDAAGETRAVAYLVILHRRMGRIEQVTTVGQTLLKIARARRMKDYQGVAQAALGWAAWRCGDRVEAERLCGAALETWKDLSFAYPFQWTAGLVILALSAGPPPDDDTLALVRLLRDPPQAHLPDPIHTALERALDAPDGPAAGEAIQAAVDAAQAEGLL